MSGLGDLFRNNLSLEKGSPLGGLVESYSNVPTSMAIHYGGKAVRGASEAAGTASTISGVMSGAVDPTSPQALKAITNAAMMYGGGSFAGAPTRPGPGMFGGRLAKNADLPALARAEQIYQPELNNAYQSLKETGWFPGSDKNFRFEFTDRPSRVPNEVLDQLNTHGAYYGKMGEGFYHPELFENYAELKEAPLLINYDPKAPREFNGGSYDPETGRITVNTTSLTGEFDPRNTILHEGQHAIQHIEGFGRGGSPAMFDKPDLAIEAHKALQHRKEREAFQRRDLTLLGDRERTDREIDKLRAALNERPVSKSTLAYANSDKLPTTMLQNMSHLYGLDRRTKPFDPIEGYYHLAGENEAFNVEKRRDMTTLERQQPGSLPWQTAKIPQKMETVLPWEGHPPFPLTRPE